MHFEFCTYGRKIFVLKSLISVSHAASAKTKLIFSMPTLHNFKPCHLILPKKRLLLSNQWDVIWVTLNIHKHTEAKMLKQNIWDNSSKITAYTYVSININKPLKEPFPFFGLFFFFNGCRSSRFALLCNCLYDHCSVCPLKSFMSTLISSQTLPNR